MDFTVSTTMISICESSPPLLNIVESCNDSFNLTDPISIDRFGWVGEAHHYLPMAESFIPYIPNDSSGGVKKITLTKDVIWNTDCTFGVGASNNLRSVFTIPNDAITSKVSYDAFIVHILAASTMPSRVILTVRASGITSTIPQEPSGSQAAFPVNTIDHVGSGNVTMELSMTGASQRQWGLTKTATVHATLTYIVYDL